MQECITVLSTTGSVVRYHTDSSGAVRPLEDALRQQAAHGPHAAESVRLPHFFFCAVHPQSTFLSRARVGGGGLSPLADGCSAQVERIRNHMQTLSMFPLDEMLQRAPHATLCASLSLCG